MTDTPTAANDDGSYKVEGSVVRITATDDGPYKVEGSFTLERADGTPIKTRETAFLCRCGASTKKPLCDGTHSKIGFAAAERAVSDEQ